MTAPTPEQVVGFLRALAADPSLTVPSPQYLGRQCDVLRWVANEIGERFDVDPDDVPRYPVRDALAATP